MKNNKGFTLIELIMVTIILGILAAVAVPRMLGTVDSAEEAAEEAVVAALRAAVEDYATQMFITDGRYEYPDDPFSLVDVTGYVGTGSSVTGTNDGDWWANPEDHGGGPDGLLIKHRRKSDEVYAWTYFPNDHSNGDSDDRGINVGGSVAHLEVFDADGNSQGFAGPSNQFNGKCVENCD
jgi:prepilin-type N-terminal cleavage/methylation domain-containing protein